MSANRLYRKGDKVQDGLFDGLSRLFHKKKSVPADHEIGERIKFVRSNGQNANGIINNVYWNNEDNAVDYGVQASFSLDDVVVPEEAIYEEVEREEDKEKAESIFDSFPNANPDDIADFIVDSWNDRLTVADNLRKFRRMMM